MYDQNQLQTINEIIRENPEKLFNALGLDFEIKNNKIYSPCIVHCGDNIHSLTINLDIGYWKCWSHSCEQVFQKSLIGFTRAVLSNQKLDWRRPDDKIISFKSCLAYIGHIYSISNISKIISPEETEKMKWVSTFMPRKVKPSNIICSVEDFLEKTKPSQYFINRGFSLNVLERFCVRSCINNDSYFAWRSLCPTFDISGGTILGISGRTETDRQPKWLHSKGFPGGSTLYGLWLAEEIIKKKREIILVEGPADVWRLWEAGGRNCVGLNGGCLTPAKHFLLDQMGVMNIILAMDADAAGKKHTEMIENSYKNLYNIKKKQPPPGKDWGETPINTVKDIFNL